MTSSAASRFRLFVALMLPLATLLLYKPTASGQTELLSIRNVHIGSDEYVDKLEIRTWAVTILAVCHLPPGWELTAVHYVTLDGALRGHATMGTAYIGPKNVSEFEEIVLVSIFEYQAKAAGHYLGHGEYEHPASLSGFLHIGTYGSDTRYRKAVLAPSNFVRVPAARCPDPPKPAE